MKFSFVNGIRREAEKGLSGKCIGCDQPTIPKCGPVKVNHWAHKSRCECDHWWENETEWHRSWKNNFAIECQEFRQRADNGEWHIADVKTKLGHFLEFQHSFLRPEERQARNAFYGSNLVWVVNGLRKKRDLGHFNALLKDVKHLHKDITLYLLPTFLEECPIVNEWSACGGPVFFDFGIEFPLWCLLPKSSKGAHYMGPLSRKMFIDLQNGLLTEHGQNFSSLMRSLNDLIIAYENPEQSKVPQQNSVSEMRRAAPARRPSVPLSQALRYLYYSNIRPRRRFRF